MDPAYLVTKPCPGCAVQPGELHVERCEFEDCHLCGPFRMGAQDGNTRSWPREHRKHARPTAEQRIPWDGVGDGLLAARDVGWFSFFDEANHRWVRCEDRPDACPDSNRVIRALRGVSVDRLRWDFTRRRWVTESR
jgi:hypothetical protein